MEENNNFLDKRYKVGDVVRIIHNNEWRTYGHDSDMNALVGTENPITLILEKGVRAAGWSWAWESIEPVNMPEKAPIKPVERVKKKRLPTLRTRLTNACKTEHGVSSAAIVGTDKYGKRKRQGVHAAQICHAFVKNYFSVTEFYENISAHYRVMSEGNRPLYVKYVNYILKRSPWAPAFLTKSFGVGLRYNISVNCALPRQHIMSAITALRMGSEFQEHLKLFSKMAPVYGEDYAFIIASTTSLTSHWKDVKYLLNVYAEGHFVFDTSTRYENLVKFFKEGFPPSKDTLWKDGHADYNGRFGVFALVHYGNMGDRAAEALARKTVTSEKIGWTVYKEFTEEGLKAEVEYWKTL